MLTDKQIQALKTDRPQEEFTDGSLPGFSIRVTKAGKKAFTLLYRLPLRLDSRRTQRRVTLGHYPYLSLGEARRRVREILGVLASGRTRRPKAAAGLPSGAPDARRPNGSCLRASWSSSSPTAICEAALEN